MTRVLEQRAGNILTIYGTAAVCGGLFKQTAPTVEQAYAFLLAALAAVGPDGAVVLEGAVLYGWGHEQKVLGRALERLPPALRARIRYINKVGRILVPKRSDLKTGQPPGIWPGELEQSGLVESWAFGYSDTCQILGMSIALTGVKEFHAVYVHDPLDCMQELRLSRQQYWDYLTKGGPGDGNGILPALVENQKAGITGKIGMGLKDIATAEWLLEQDIELWDAMSVTQYSLLFHEEFLTFVERWKDRLRDRGTPVELIAAGPYAGGPLSRDPRGEVADKVHANYRLATPLEIRRACLFWDLANRHGMPTPMPAAIQFVAAQPYLSAVVLGPRDAQDVSTNADYLRQVIPLAFWHELRAMEIDGQPLIHPNAPLPSD